jgi:hypothetical protein
MIAGLVEADLVTAQREVVTGPSPQIDNPAKTFANFYQPLFTHQSGGHLGFDRAAGVGGKFSQLLRGAARISFWVRKIHCIPERGEILSLE